MPAQGKLKENSGEGSGRYRRAHRSLHFDKGQGRRTDRTKKELVGSFRSFPLDTGSFKALSGESECWKNRERVVLDLLSNLKRARSSGYFL